MSDERAPRFALSMFVAAALALVGGALVLSRLIDQPPGEERVIIIPAGTGDRMAAGEDVQLIPADLTFRLRDQLVVINNDSQVHQVGPFTVKPGDRLEEEFAETATIEGFCSLHPSGRITITIGGT